MTVPSLADYKTPRPWLTLGIFLVVVIGVGALIGTQSVPGAWYESLEKPPFNPPNWIFGPVWFTLYVTIAVAGWRIWMVDPRSDAMKVWFAQMAFNWAWSPIWFLGQMLWPAFAVIVAILALIVAFIVVARKYDAIASWLFVPYLAWVSFASLLNLSIAILN
ncbi:tryptophan-rich sensory protein [Devosia oryziradicis]|uniref:Tryptophan-rich sensory protein n=1 Tax=Devosia oryziradicis TaxID=2801335 RepID=A0ABX7BWS4_9HYPH|nr:TspO/MBR family protein [Devosia oryziradicis]QQR35499.1 tryptophan-rich sensory protein [Devosia oryziradicis]